MTFLLRTLSLSYLARHKAKTLLTVLGVVVGVATFSAIRGAQTALVSGIRGTVDRMAGKAQLQVLLEGGVPEEVQERIRDVPSIRAQSPVIEQIVVADDAKLGSLLVLGVDLLGDREMRDYGFEGDADLDDPLLFLAQPDSIALARTLAEKAGVKVGDPFVFRTPGGPKRVIVRGLLTPRGFAESFGGNLAVMDVYAAQTLFGRGRRFDRLEIRLQDDATLAQGTAAVSGVLGPGYRVETPDRRGAQMEELITIFVAGFDITSGFALGIGTFLIFNAFTVSVNRRRRDVGTLRSLGATPRQVQALFLLEGVVIGLVGGALGLLAGSALAGSFLKMMGTTTEQIYGIAEASGVVRLTPALALQALGLGVLASLVGAWGPARAASRIAPTEAFAKGVFQAHAAGRAGRPAAGLALLAAAIGIALHPPFGGMPFVFLVLGLGTAGVVLATGPLARQLLVRAMPVVSRLAPATGPLSSDALLSNPRRTSGTVTAMTLTLSFVLGLGGYMEAAKGALVRWMNDILTSDFYVRGSASFARPDYRYPASVREELLGLPGVRAVESYRACRIPYRGAGSQAAVGTGGPGSQIVLFSLETEGLLARTRHEFLQGDQKAMREGLLSRKCAVSDNFHRLFGLGVGDSVEIAAPTGIVRIPIAVVFRDYTSDRGSVLIDRAYFVELWQDDRVDTFDVNLTKGADPEAVRGAIRTLLAGRMPALVSSRKEFTAEIGQAIDAFYSLIRVTLVLALVVAFLGIVTSLLISVAERSREIGILKSLGGLGAQIRRSVVLEAIALGLTGLALAVPVGALVAVFMQGTVAEVFAGWRMPNRYPWELLLTLVVALPVVSTVAAWVPARQAARVKVTEAITYE